MKRYYTFPLVSLVACMGFSLFAPFVSAKETMWSGSVPESTLYRKNSFGSWVSGLSDASVSVRYAASVYDAAGVEIMDGSSVKVGSTVKFVPESYDDIDIGLDGETSWIPFYFQTVPVHGYWGSDTGLPSAACDDSNPVGKSILPVIIPNLLAAMFTYNFVPLSVAEPSVSLQQYGTAALSCAGMECVVDSPGTIQADIVFSSTQGMFYSKWMEVFTGFVFGLCNGSDEPMRAAGASSGYVLDIPSQSVSFSFDVITPLYASCGSVAGTAVTSAPTADLCSAGTPSAVTTNASSYDWTCFGENGGTDASCTAPTAESLTLCYQGGVMVLDTVGLLVGETRNLTAHYGTNGNCSDADVTSTTTWSENTGSGVVSLSGLNPMTVTAGTTGSELVSATYSGHSDTVTFDVSAPCTWDCHAQEVDYCYGEPFSVIDSCGNDQTCTGTRNCNFNWREVAPGE